MKLKLILLYIFILSKFIFPSFSFQGFSGVINTPNTKTIREGDGVIHYNNQLDSHILNYNKNKINLFEEQTYNFGIGFFNNFEFIGRLSNINRKENKESYFIRDLSANIKFKIPFSHKYLPNIAFGIQDLGGAANNYDNKYAVLDKQIHIFRPSIGYGKATGIGRSSRMNGIFGALEIEAFNWLDILFEYDGKEKHTGLRLNFPNSLFSNFNINGLFSKNIDTKSYSFGINLEIPLFNRSKRLNIIDNNYINKLNNFNIADDDHINKLSSFGSGIGVKSILDFQKMLINFGFENVRIGKIDNTLYIEYENTIFSHNTIDSFGYILGKIAFSNLKFKKYKLVLLKNNLKIFSISGSIKIFKKYILDESLINLKDLKKNMRFSKSFNNQIIFFTDKENSSFFTPRLSIFPDISSTTGTEVGVFDYHLISQFHLYANIYDGLSASILYKTPITRTKNFRKGEIFYSKLRDEQ